MLSRKSTSVADHMPQDPSTRLRTPQRAEVKHLTSTSVHNIDASSSSSTTSPTSRVRSPLSPTATACSSEGHEVRAAVNVPAQARHPLRFLDPPSIAEKVIGLISTSLREVDSPIFRYHMQQRPAGQSPSISLPVAAWPGLHSRRDNAKVIACWAAPRSQARFGGDCSLEDDVAGTTVRNNAISKDIPRSRVLDPRRVYLPTLHRLHPPPWYRGVSARPWCDSGARVIGLPWETLNLAILSSDLEVDGSNLSV